VYITVIIIIIIAGLLCSLLLLICIVNFSLLSFVCFVVITPAEVRRLFFCLSAHFQKNLNRFFDEHFFGGMIDLMAIRIAVWTRGFLKKDTLYTTTIAVDSQE